MISKCPRCKNKKQIMLRQNICFDCFEEISGMKRAIRPARKPLTDQQQKAIVANAAKILEHFGKLLIRAFVSSANEAIDNKTLSSEIVGESE